MLQMYVCNEKTYSISILQEECIYIDKCHVKGLGQMLCRWQGAGDKDDDGVTGL